MKKRMLHTPEGVRDIYGNELIHKHNIQNALMKDFRLFGYKTIETPTFEFFDVFSKEIGTTKSNELYKFFDKEGNTLVLRPDFTPSIVRCAAKYYMEETIPVRFSYIGHTFTNTSNLQGKLKEVTQTGVELIGGQAKYTDAEIIHLAVKALKDTGLEDFQISIGEVTFLRGLCEECGLDDELEMDVREYISNKNYFGLEELLTEKGVEKEQTERFLKIVDLFGSAECIDSAEELVHNEKSKHAIHQLRHLYDTLKALGDEKYVSFDMGMVSKYKYYTGIIFKAYTYGVGDCILKGGRYDKLLSYYGKDESAIGFVIVVDDLLAALTRQKRLDENKPYITYLLYDESEKEKAYLLSDAIRNQGICTECTVMDKTKSVEDYLIFASNNQINKVLHLNADEKVLVYELENNSKSTTPVDSIEYKDMMNNLKNNK